LSVEEAVAGQDAVLSTLGVPYSRKPITLYSQGTAHIVWAMNRYGVRRLVCVSSSGVDPHPELLDRMLLLGRRHLQIALLGYVAHYNQHRPHRTLGQAPPLGAVPPPAPAANVRILRVDRLGGLIHEYIQVA